MKASFMSLYFHKIVSVGQAAACDFLINNWYAAPDFRKKYEIKNDD